MKYILQLLFIFFTIFSYSQTVIDSDKTMGNDERAGLEDIELAPNDSNLVYSWTDTKAEFPGGYIEMIKFIKRNIKYPSDKTDLTGNVFVSLLIEKDGAISEILVVKSFGDKAFDNEAVRVCKMMPKWSAGKIKGEPVRSKVTIPFYFRVN